MSLTHSVPPAPVETRRSVLGTLRALGTCRTLVRLVEEAGLDEDLAGAGPELTLFAPTDAAFARLAGPSRELLDPDGERDPEAAEALIDRLEYHLVRGRLDLEAALDAGGVRTLHGAEVHVALVERAILVDGARVRSARLGCTNGVVYVIDAVLAPAVIGADPWSFEAEEPAPRSARTLSRAVFTSRDDAPARAIVREGSKARLLPA